MLEAIKISENIYHLGVNDRQKHLFENLWPLPQGVCYNSYLINDEKTALLDTVESGSNFNFVQMVERTLNGRDLDYLIINHMEPDHAGEIDNIVTRWPNVTVIGNNKTTKIVKAYLGDYISVQEVKEGEELSLGKSNLKFTFTPWIHWPETMMSYETTTQTLFSGDAFGTFGSIEGGIFDDEICFEYYESEMRRYFSNIVGKYCGMVQKALKKLEGVPVSTICSLHGPIWRTNPSKVIELYNKWSSYQADEAVVVIYSSMYGSNETTADYIARKISENGVKNIRVYDASKTHISYLISEIWRCKGVVLGSCAYNTEMHPSMELLTTELTHYGVKDKKVALFGTCSWNGGGVRNLKAFVEKIGWEEVAPALEVMGRPTLEKVESAKEIAIAMAEAIK